MTTRVGLDAGDEDQENDQHQRQEGIVIEKIIIELLGKRPTQTRKVTKCKHTDSKHYAKGMCN